MAESDIIRFTKQQETKNILLRLFMKNRTETWIYNLNYLKPKCQSELCQFDKYRRRRINYTYSLRL